MLKRLDGANVPTPSKPVRQRSAGPVTPTPAVASVPLLATYDAYAKTQGMTVGVRDEWRRVMVRLIDFLGHDDAARITPDDVLRWRNQLQEELTAKGTPRDPRTIRGKYISALKATLNWAVQERKLPSNAAATVVVRVPKKAKLRDRDFTAGEARAILTASMAPSGGRQSPEYVLARRWIPWLCAYTGARVNEFSQLRGEDVRQVDGIWTVRITPEAGSVKNNEARVVPLHSHLIEQGFIEFVAASGDGPLFYDPKRQRVAGEHNRHFKKVGERLAQWVRKDVGITDPALQPNHAWRNTFKTRAFAAGLQERIVDAIQGHAPSSVSQSYGSTSVVTMAGAIEQMPRFEVG
jgi:integrase